MSDKPAILQDSEFTIEEGFGYRAARTGAIWMNKLFFAALVLLAVWLVLASLQDERSCAGGTPDGGNATDDAAPTCSVFLTPTAKYLGAMAIISFLLSLAFGALGLVLGKRIVALTPADQEVGAPDAPRAQGEEATDGSGGLPRRGP